MLGNSKNWSFKRAIEREKKKETGGIKKNSKTNKKEKERVRKRGRERKRNWESDCSSQISRKTKKWKKQNKITPPPKRKKNTQKESEWVFKSMSRLGGVRSWIKRRSAVHRWLNMFWNILSVILNKYHTFIKAHKYCNYLSLKVFSCTKISFVN